MGDLRKAVILLTEAVQVLVDVQTDMRRWDGASRGDVIAALARARVELSTPDGIETADLDAIGHVGVKTEEVAPLGAPEEGADCCD